MPVRLLPQSLLSTASSAVSHVTQPVTDAAAYTARLPLQLLEQGAGYAGAATMALVERILRDNRVASEFIGGAMGQLQHSPAVAELLGNVVSSLPEEQLLRIMQEGLGTVPELVRTRPAETADVIAAGTEVTVQQLPRLTREVLKSAGVLPEASSPARAATEPVQQLPARLDETAPATDSSLRDRAKEAALNWWAHTKTHPTL